MLADRRNRGVTAFFRLETDGVLVDSTEAALQQIAGFLKSGNKPTAEKLVQIGAEQLEAELDNRSAGISPGHPEEVKAAMSLFAEGVMAMLGGSRS